VSEQAEVKEMKGLCAFIVIACLALSAFSSLGLSQSREEAEKLYGEAQALDRELQGGSREKYMQALDAFERLGDKKRVADVGVSLANKYGFPKADKAIPLYEKSLSSYQELNDRKAEGETLKELAIICYQSHDYAKAEAYSDKALTVFRDLKDRAGEAWSLVWLGHLHRKAGRYDKAVECYEKGNAIDREPGDRATMGIAALTSLGGTYRDMGQHQKAVESYEKLVSLCRELKNPHCAADGLQSLVRVYSQLGNREKASECGKELRTVVDEIMAPGRKRDTK
jgi:tetratricopeptide (TPR) repeat protein